MHNEVGTCTEILPNFDVTISHIEIVFDFNVHTRAHFGLRAKKKLQIRTFLSLCHAHNSQLFFTTDEEAAASKCMVFYVFSAQKSIGGFHVT